MAAALAAHVKDSESEGLSSASVAIANALQRETQRPEEPSSRSHESSSPAMAAAAARVARKAANDCRTRAVLGVALAASGAARVVEIPADTSPPPPQNEKREGRRKTLCAPQARRGSLLGRPVAHTLQHGGGSTQESRMGSGAATTAAEKTETRSERRDKSLSPPRSGASGSPPSTGIQPPVPAAVVVSNRSSKSPPAASRLTPPRHCWQSRRKSISPEQSRWRNRFGSPAGAGGGTAAAANASWSPPRGERTRSIRVSPEKGVSASTQSSRKGAGDTAFIRRSVANLSPPAGGTGRVPVRMGSGGRRKSLSFSPSRGSPAAAATVAIRALVEDGEQRPRATVLPTRAPPEPLRSSRSRAVQEHASNAAESSDSSCSLHFDSVDARSVTSVPAAAAEPAAATVPNPLPLSVKCGSRESASSAAESGISSDDTVAVGRNSQLLEALPLPEHAINEGSPRRINTSVVTPLPKRPCGDVAMEIAKEERRPEIYTERYTERFARGHSAYKSSSSLPLQSPAEYSTTRPHITNCDSCSSHEGSTKECSEDRSAAGRSKGGSADTVVEEESRRLSGAFVQGRDRRRRRKPAPAELGRWEEMGQFAGDGTSPSIESTSKSTSCPSFSCSSGIVRPLTPPAVGNMKNQKQRCDNESDGAGGIDDEKITDTDDDDNVGDDSGESDDDSGNEAELETGRESDSELAADEAGADKTEEASERGRRPEGVVDRLHRRRSRSGWSRGEGGYLDTGGAGDVGGDGGGIVLDSDLPLSSDNSDAASQYSTPCSSSLLCNNEVGVCFMQ